MIKKRHEEKTIFARAVFHTWKEPVKNIIYIERKAIVKNVAFSIDSSTSNHILIVASCHYRHSLENEILPIFAEVGRITYFQKHRRLLLYSVKSTVIFFFDGAFEICLNSRKRSSLSIAHISKLKKMYNFFRINVFFTNKKLDIINAYRHNS